VAFGRRAGRVEDEHVQAGVLAGLPLGEEADDALARHLLDRLEEVGTQLERLVMADVRAADDDRHDAVIDCDLDHARVPAVRGDDALRGG
jgi:hypothetical protein